MKEKVLDNIYVALTWTFVIAIILLTTVLTKRGEIVDGNVGNLDFLSYYSAALIVKNGEGRNLYNSSYQSGIQKHVATENDIFVPYRYPPFIALIFLPLSCLPYLAAYKIFVFINLGLEFFVAKFLIHTLPRIRSKLTYLLVFSFVPLTIWSIIFGQVTILLFVLFLAIFAFSIKKKWMTVGMLTALFSIKPHYLMIAPFIFMVVAEKKKFLLGFLAGLSFLFLVSLLVTNWQTLINYPRFLLGTEEDILAQQSLTAALTTFMGKVIGYSPLSYRTGLFINFILYFVFLFLYLVKSNKWSTQKKFVMMTLFSLPFFPHSWEYDFVILLFPILFLINNRAESKDSKLRNKLLVMVILLLLTPVWRFLHVPSLTSLGAIIVGLLVYSRNDLAKI